MRLALRMDDINASTKIFNQYSNKWWRFKIGNIGPLKRQPYFRAWGIYDELSESSWLTLLKILREQNACLTVGVTAAWVEHDGQLVPVDKKIPRPVAVLKEGVSEGIIEIANHGLTHCVLEDNAYLPKIFFGNRKYHREFWEWIPEIVHRQHMEQSQAILERTFGTRPKLFVPPGNVFTEKTLQFAKQSGIDMVNCHLPNGDDNSGILPVLSNQNIIAFHDREIALYGENWLIDIIHKQQVEEFCFVSELFCEQ